MGNSPRINIDESTKYMFFLLLYNKNQLNLLSQANNYNIYKTFCQAMIFLLSFFKKKKILLKRTNSLYKEIVLQKSTTVS